MIVVTALLHSVLKLRVEVVLVVDLQLFHSTQCQAMGIPTTTLAIDVSASILPVVGLDSNMVYSNSAISDILELFDWICYLHSMVG